MIVVPAHDGYIVPFGGFCRKNLISSILLNIAQKKLSALDLLKMVPNEVVLTKALPGENPAFLFKNVNVKKEILF